MILDVVYCLIMKKVIYTGKLHEEDIMSGVFDFISDKDSGEIATGGNPKKVDPGTITDEMRDEAKKLASSPKGLNIEAFQRKHKIHVLNVDELLKG